VVFSGHLAGFRIPAERGLFMYDSDGWISQSCERSGMDQAAVYAKEFLFKILSGVLPGASDG
jgi:hypothetical protein